MHRLGKMDLWAHEAFDEGVDANIKHILISLQKEYNGFLSEAKQARENDDEAYAKRCESQAKEAYLKLLMSCPVGLNLTARMTTNYRQLKTIYKQRKNHRLPHWKLFCEWIEQLPYSIYITGNGS